MNMPNQKTFSKAAVNYTDNHGASNEQCSKCVHYVNATTCEIVVGRIRPEGWCKKFAAMQGAKAA
jgi:hypothetical protein